MSTPGIRDLIQRDIAEKDPEKCAQITSNCLLPITHGIEAIGNLMGSYNDDAGLEDGTMQNLGFLLAFLSELSAHLQFIRGDAEFTMREGAEQEAHA